MKTKLNIAFLLLALSFCACFSLHAQRPISSSDTIHWDDLKLFRLYKFMPVSGLEPLDAVQGKEVDTVNFEELDIVKAKSFLGKSLPVHKNGYQFVPLATYGVLIFIDGTVRKLKFTFEGLWDGTTDTYYDVPKERAEQWQKFTEDARTVTYRLINNDLNSTK